MYAGEKLRSCALGIFLILASGVIILVALGSIFLEYAVNSTRDSFFPIDPLWHTLKKTLLKKNCMFRLFYQKIS